MVLVADRSEDYKNFQRDHYWLAIVCGVVALIIGYVLACLKKIARSVPLNYILLLIFTLCQAYGVSFIASQYDSKTVLIASGLTAAMVLALTFYAMQTAVDYTRCGGFLVVLGVGLLVGGIVAIFVRNKYYQLGLSIFGVIVIGMYIVFDTQLILGNK